MSLYNVLKAEGKVRECVNFLISSFSCRVFESKNGQLYLVLDHHRYLNYNQAARVRIGATKMKNGLYYQTDKV